MSTAYSPRVKGSISIRGNFLLYYFALFTSGRSCKKIYLRITRLCPLTSYVIMLAITLNSSLTTKALHQSEVTQECIPVGLVPPAC